MMESSRPGFLDHRSRVEEHSPPDSLLRVYIEPTNTCNLDCPVCVRQVWDEPAGRMERETFSRIIEGMQDISPRPAIFFGGFGEPLTHPDIFDMLTAAREISPAVELITNATLLNEAASLRLVELGLDTLWVSMDAADPKDFADLRVGASLSLVTANLARLDRLRQKSPGCLAHLGIAVTLMRSNISSLPEVIRLGSSLGADRFSITNVLPHTNAMRGQILYSRCLDSPGSILPGRGHAALPPMDGEFCVDQRLDLDFAFTTLGLDSRDSDPHQAGCCPFLQKASLSIRWDGAISPCLPLLHSHTSWLGDTERFSHSWNTGNINHRSLESIWNDPAYRSFRRRLQEFDFSPCAFCNSCEMAASNIEDCFGNTHPTCGGCLWVRGFIRCP